VIGCPSGGGGGDDDKGGEEELVEKTVFDLEEGTGNKIQELAEGVITFPVSGDSHITPLVRAGGDSDVTIAIVKNGGKNAIKFTIGGADWGAGIDLPHAEFGFIAGDKILIKGEILDMGTGKAPSSGDRRFVLNRKVGSEYATIGGVDTNKKETGAFDFDITLEAADIADIAGGSPKGIRLEGRSGGMVVQINTLKITGMRPSSEKTLTAPVITIADGVVSWEAVEGASGYKVLYKEEAAADFVEVEQTATTIDLYTKITEAGTYTIKVIALGTKGSTKDSGDSNAVSFVMAGSPFPKFSNAKSLGAGKGDSSGVTGGKWSFGTGDDKNGTLDDIYDAKFFVMISKGGTNANGYGTVKFAAQGDASSDPWNATSKSTGDWTGLAHAEDDIVYFVIDLSEFTNIAGQKTGNATQVQFYIEYAAVVDVGTVVGYTTAANLTKPADGVSFTHASATLGGTSYVSKTVPTGLIQQ